jgi:hypothetical protein
MARLQRISFSSTDDHPAPFVKRTALAPMYTALGLTSLDLVIFNRKLRWVWYGMVWCPSCPLDRNRCDQVVVAGSGAG